MASISHPPEAGSVAVLVVDDVADNRTICSDYLSARGYRTESAATGIEALKKSHLFKPDVVLLDLALPLMDGLEVARQLRRDPSTRNCRIIFLTAHEHFREQAEGLCEAYVVKPCLPQDIESKIREVLNR